jgi:hypothetical protein
MEWTHRICSRCWFDRNSREPARMKFDESGKCCFCGETTDSGIYVRLSPNSAELVCHGNHDA